MEVKFKPVGEIKARLGIEPNGRVQRYFQDACYRYMDKYVPYDDGGLAYKQVDLSNPNYIVYQSPYAHYMYEGKVMGPNIPIKNKAGEVTGWFSPKGQSKHYTGKDIKYNKKAGHEYAGPHWDERMKSAEMDNLVKEVQNYINRGGR